MVWPHIDVNFKPKFWDISYAFKFQILNCWLKLTKQAGCL